MSKKGAKRNFIEKGIRDREKLAKSVKLAPFSMSAFFIVPWKVKRAEA